MKKLWADGKRIRLLYLQCPFPQLPSTKHTENPFTFSTLAKELNNKLLHSYFPAGNLSLLLARGSTGSVKRKKYFWGQPETEGVGGTTIPSPENCYVTWPKAVPNQSGWWAAPCWKRFVPLVPWAPTSSQTFTLLEYPLWHLSYSKQAAVCLLEIGKPELKAPSTAKKEAVT